MSGNSCDCPNPPGGRVTCGADQLAICRVKDGKVESQCVDQPVIDQSLSPDVKEKMIQNWALTIIKAEQRAPMEEITSEDNSILRSGAYYSAETGETVTFSLPAEIKAKAAAIVTA